MDIERARTIEAGDSVSYGGVPRRVLAVTHAGLWAPYFEIEDEGVVSHILVSDAPSSHVTPAEMAQTH
jgi:hypothetical protein